LAESGLFNGLQRIQIKKLFAAAPSSCSMAMPESGSAPRFPRSDALRDLRDPVNRKYSTWSGFSQTNVTSRFAVRRFRRSAPGARSKLHQIAGFGRIPALLKGRPRTAGLDVKRSLRIATVVVEVGGGIRSLAPRIGGSKLIVCWAPRLSALRRYLARIAQEAIFRGLSRVSATHVPSAFRAGSAPRLDDA
jgi:hypothetical protein